MKLHIPWMKSLEIHSVKYDSDFFLWNGMVSKDVFLNHFRDGNNSLDLITPVLFPSYPDLDMMLDRKIPLHELIGIIKRIGDRKEFLLKISFLHSPMRIKNIHGKVPSHSMNDVEVVGSEDPT